MLNQIHYKLLNECHVDTTRPILLGVSGGPDSLVLLDVLSRLGFPVIAAHFDHHVRPDSTAEVQVVKQMAQHAGANFVAGEADTAEYADQHHLSLEEAGRSLRYRFLFEQAENLKAQAVATAHTANDQAETVLMHLLRGAGLSGLRGMPVKKLPNLWSTSISLIRPLLDTSRSEIEAYLNEHALKPIIDPTNADPRWYRNRLRHEALPYLDSLNPGVVGRLVQMARLLGDEDALLEQLTQHAWGTCLDYEGDRAVGLKLEALRELPVALQRRVFRRAVSSLRPGLRDIDFAAAEHFSDFIALPSRTQRVDLVAGLRVEIDGSRLWLAAWDTDLPNFDAPQMPVGSPSLTIYPQSISWLPENLPLDHGWVLSADVLPIDNDLLGSVSLNEQPYQAFLNLDLIPGSLVVRTRRPGDRYQPLGMFTGSIKLSDYMINAKIPRRLRERWPIVSLADNNETVAWVPGFPPAESLAIRPGYRRALWLSVQREKS